jgi:hypothetical protein
MSIEKRSVFDLTLVSLEHMKRDDRSISRAPHPIARLRSAISLVETVATSDRAREVFLERAQGVLDRFERVSETMQKVADVQLEVMEKLRPIVDDLGELVRLSLTEARNRGGALSRANEVTIEHPPIREEDREA